jgi:peptidyl-prolyl cis-trans isomerase SurA
MRKMRRLFFRTIISVFIFAFSYNFYANAENHSEKVVAEVGQEKITFGQLQKAFRKNMNRENADLKDVSRDSVMDFLNLYINYRLKVLDAIDRGYAKDSAVAADIKANRNILAESFFYDRKLMRPSIERLLEKRKREKKFAVILIPFANVATGDTAEAFKNLNLALAELESGTPFGEVAKEYSKDKNSAKSGGVIKTYITAGKVQRPIENAIYSLEEGEYTKEPVSTRYGYFIIKLIDDAPRKLVRARHILISEGLEDDSLATVKHADSLIALLRNGADFARLAEEFSDDPSSAMKGGVMGYYSRSTGFEGTGRHVVPEFEEALFDMEDGEISGKVYSDYGIHIIMRDTTKAIDEKAEREDLRNLYKRLYYEKDKREFIDEKKYEYGYELNEQVFDELLAALDTNSTNLDSAWSAGVGEDLRSRTLFELLGDETTVDEFISAMNNQGDLRGLGLNKKGLSTAIRELVTPVVFAEATKNLENEYEDFAELMDEFRDGILLFRVEAEEVWDKLKFDTVAARKYWRPKKSEYMTDRKFDISEIYFTSDSTAKYVLGQIKENGDFAEYAKEYTQRSGYREKNGKWGLVSVEDNELAKYIDNEGAEEGKVYGPFEYEKGWSVVKLNDIEQPRVKTFEEAIPDFAPEFQDMMQKKLTREWMARAREKFDVEIYEDKIEQILN